MQVCVCTCVHTQVHMQMEARGPCLLSSQSLSALFFKTMPFSEPGICHGIWTGWPTSLRCWGYMHIHPIPSFSMLLLIQQVLYWLRYLPRPTQGNLKAKMFWSLLGNGIWRAVSNQHLREAVSFLNFWIYKWHLKHSMGMIYKNR